MSRLDAFFEIRARGSTVPTELRAGAVTFLTMAYILLVNPQVLAQAGMPAEDVVIATALSSALATLIMGLYAKFPFALAPGMGLNAYFTFGVVQGLGVSWQTALTAVFLEGLLFLVLAFLGIRTGLLNAIPDAIKSATMTGIGLFLAVIGFQNARIIVAHPATLVSLGDLQSAPVLLALAGVVLIATLMTLRLPGALLVGIAAVTAVAWVSGLAPAPRAAFSLPRLPRETLAALDFSAILSAPVLGATLSFLFVDLFDTAGTLIGVGRLGGFTNARGELPGADRAFVADAIGTSAGALLGTSTVTSYIESAAGVEEGGRTGLTAVTVAALFLLALFMTPLFIAVPTVATAPALIVVGALMMQGARSVRWEEVDEAVPAFLTIAAMPFTYSIATGITFGIVSYVLIKLLAGKPRDAHPLMYLLSALLVLYYALGR